MMNTVTMQDIASKAGVSRRTVSDALNNKKSFVSQATRDRVKQIAEELGYKPNYFAKSLKQGKTQCIGFLSGPMIADFRFPNVSDTVSGVALAMEARKSPYSLLIFGANYHQGYDETISLIKKGLVDGLLIMIISLHLEQFEQVLLPVLRDHQIPFVVIHSLARKLAYNNVGVNAPGGTYQATRHLVSLGYRHIKYYIRKFESALDHELFEGFKQAMTEAGLPADESSLIYPSGNRRSVLTHYQDAYHTAQELREIPEAIIASNDQQAIGLLRGFRARRVQVPEDVALIANNGANPNLVFADELTQICHPFDKKTRAAVDILHETMEQKKGRDTIYQETIEPELMIRTTCGAKLKPADHVNA